MLQLMPYICACLLALALPAMAAPKPMQNNSVVGAVGVGSPAPDFKLANTKGETRTLNQYRGKVVVLNFWASWCPPCRKEMPSMDRLNKLFPRSEVILLAVNVEKRLPDTFRRAGFSFDILSDSNGQVQQRYGVTRLPETFIIDRKGIVSKRVIGGIVWDDPGVVSYLQSLYGS